MEQIPVQESELSKHKGLFLLGILLLMTVLSAFAPASWLGIQTQRGSNDSDLTSVGIINATPKDKATNKPLTWKEIASQVLVDQPDVLASIQNTPEDPATIAQLNDENNLTASFSRNLLAASAYFKENNITDADSQQSVVRQLADQEITKVVPTSYGIKNIHLAKTETKESIKAYANAMAAILSGLVSEKTVLDNGTALTAFSKTSDPASLLPVKKDEQRVATAVEKLLAVSVPPSAVIYHISALNHIAAYRDDLHNLANIDTDPLRANVALQTYTTTAFAAFSVYVDLGAYFDVKNIVFTTKDPGYVFTIGYTS